MNDVYIDIRFSIKSVFGHWQLPIAYEIPKNDLVDDMKLWPPVTSPDVYCIILSKRRETSLRGEGAESIQLCDFRVGQATTGAEAQFWLRQQ